MREYDDRGGGEGDEVPRSVLPRVRSLAFFAASRARAASTAFWTTLRPTLGLLPALHQSFCFSIEVEKFLVFIVGEEGADPIEMSLCFLSVS